MGACTISSAQTPLTQELAARMGLQGRVLWVDCAHNQRTLNSEPAIRALVNRAASAGFNAMVLDVKFISGEVVYSSRIAPRMTEWRGSRLPADLDVLAVALDEAHKRGIELHAGFNVFTEGHRHLGRGPAYSRPGWQVHYAVTSWRLVLPDGNAIPLRESTEVTNTDDIGRIITAGTVTPKDAAGRYLFVFNASNICEGYVNGDQLPEAGLPVPQGGFIASFGGDIRPMLPELIPTGAAVSLASSMWTVPAEAVDVPEAGIFVNPALPAVRDYQLSLIREVLRNYPVDGVVMDRMRYPSIWADFSDEARRQFETWLGRSVDRWPHDILIPRAPNVTPDLGPLGPMWQHWRARTIRDFLREVRRVIQETRPSARLSAYVGSWYGDYYPVGVEWGSDLTPSPYSWAPPDYRLNGLAGHLDFLMTGCYYPWVTMADARAAGKPAGASVEAAAQLSVRAARSSCWVYAGIYLLDYRNDPARCRQALRMAMRNSQGVMVFDNWYLDEYNWWDLIREEFARPAQPPHGRPDLLEEARRADDLIIPR